MKDYQRLTDRKENRGYLEEEFWVSAKEPSDTEIDEIYSRLAELEDKIENGMLLELPCKVGDTIYIIDSFEFVDGKKSYLIREKTIGMIVIVGAGNIYTTDDLRDFYDKDFGKTVFTIKSKAEQKLKELRGEE